VDYSIHHHDQSVPRGIPVDALGLPPGLCAALRRWGYGTVRALTYASPSELLDVPGVGPRRLTDVEGALARLGLSLREDTIDLRGAHPLAAPVMDALAAGEREENVARELGVPRAAVRAWRAGCRPTEGQTRSIRSWATARGHRSDLEESCR
jgi:hypothetical protein